MQARLRQVDCLIEICDARLSLLARNPHFAHTLGSARPHILVINKVDLIKANRKAEIETVMKERCGAKHVIWSDLKKAARPLLQKLLQILLTELQQMPRYHRTLKSE